MARAPWSMAACSLLWLSCAEEFAVELQQLQLRALEHADDTTDGGGMDGWVDAVPHGRSNDSRDGGADDRARRRTRDIRQLLGVSTERTLGTGFPDVGDVGRPEFTGDALYELALLKRRRSERHGQSCSDGSKPAAIDGLTNYMRDAFVSAAMNDVPQEDFGDQIQTLLIKAAISYLPPKVRALYDDPATRDFVRHTQLPCGFNYTYVPGLGTLPIIYARKSAAS